MNIRLNTAVADLVQHHKLTVTDAASLCAELESQHKWFVRWGLVVGRTPIPVAQVRSWLIKHGYMQPSQVPVRAGGERSNGN